VTQRQVLDINLNPLFSFQDSENWNVLGGLYEVLIEQEYVLLNLLHVLKMEIILYFFI